VGAAIGELQQRMVLLAKRWSSCTKGGYLPFDGAPPRDVRGYIEQNFINTGIAAWGDIAGGSHCMTPAYLNNQLQQSLRNLQARLRRRLLRAQSGVATVSGVARCFHATAAGGV
jgi:hypothetical protein